MTRLYTLFVLALLVGPATSGDQAGASPLPFRKGKDYALFFAVNDYASNSGFDDLSKPIQNAESIAAELHDSYDFDTTVVRNPTLDQITAKLYEFRDSFAQNPGGRYPREGQLLIYFTGHGIASDKNGYFVPSDGNANKLYSTAFAYEIWRRFIDQMNCQHILVVIDACYSVTFDPDWYDPKMGLDSFYRPGELSARDRLLMINTSDRCRIVFSSDGSEDKVPERSNFARIFLEGLRKGPRQDGILTSEEMASLLRRSAPKPRLTAFGDDKNGSFLFVSNKRPESKDATSFISNEATDDDAWENVRLSNTEVAYNSYLLLFRKGKHRQEAQAAIDSIQLSRLSRTIHPPDPFWSKMVFVDGGVFDMGCSGLPGQDCPDHELPRHQVKLNSFYIGIFEVTQSDWLEIMGEKASDLTPYCAECPVVGVSWDMTQRFLERLNSLTSGNYRLPTEAEWEYAARGGAKSKGFLYAGDHDLELVAWHDGNSGGTFHPVGKKRANELGLYDMSGNVCEWCQDKWHVDYQGAPGDGSSWVLGGTVGRVFRGGCWNRLYLGCHTSARYWDYPYSRFDNVGFRLARTP